VLSMLLSAGLQLAFHPLMPILEPDVEHTTPAEVHPERPSPVL